MLSILIKFVFGVINKIVSLLFTPLFALLDIFAPISILGDIINSILSFVRLALNYFNFFVDLLCIPPILFQVIFTILLGVFTFSLSVKIITLSISIYKSFKP